MSDIGYLDSSNGLFTGSYEFICAQLISHYSHLIMFKGSDNCYKSICLRQVARGHKLLPGCFVNNVNVKKIICQRFLIIKQACMRGGDLIC